jgi:hypothetical protein
MSDPKQNGGLSDVERDVVEQERRLASVLTDVLMKRLWKLVEGADRIVGPIPDELRLSESDLEAMSYGDLPSVARESVVRAWGPATITVRASEAFPLPDQLDTDGMEPADRDRLYRALNREMFVAAREYLQQTEVVGQTERRAATPQPGPSPDLPGRFSDDGTNDRGAK